jgi:hypothetical protein
MLGLVICVVVDSLLVAVDKRSAGALNRTGKADEDRELRTGIIPSRRSDAKLEVKAFRVEVTLLLDSEI